MEKALRTLKVILLLAFLRPGLATSQTPKIDSLTRLLELAEHDTMRALLMVDIGMEVYFIEKTRGFDLASQALSISEQNRFALGKARSHNLLGLIYGRMENDYANAFRNFSKSAEIYEQMGNLPQAAKNYSNLGLVFHRQGNNKLALEYFFKAMEMHERAGTREQMAGVLNNLGNTYHQLRKNDEALESYQKALEINLMNPDGASQLGANYHNIAVMQVEMGEFVDAELNLRKALRHHRLVGDSAGVLSDFIKLSAISIEFEALDKALEQATYAQSMARQVNIPISYAEAQAQLGVINEALSKHEIAISHFNASLRIADSVRHADLIRNALENLKEIHARNGDFKLAYDYSERLQAHNDSIINKEVLDNAGRLEAQFVMGQQIKEIELENQQLQRRMEEEAERDRMWKTYALVVIFLAISIIMLLAYFITVKKRDNAELAYQKEEILQQKEEIEAQNNELHRYQNHLQQLVDDQTKDLILAKERAEQSERLKTAFLANISHEIRTPINAINGFSSLLNYPGLTDENRQKYVNIITSNTDQLLRVINDIVDISKLETNQLEIFKTDFDLYDCMKERFGTFEKNLAKKGKPNLSLALEFDHELSGERFVTDKARFEQVLYNLIDNAIKFTEKGKITFGVKMQDTETLLFFVEDTGIGMSPANQELAFSPFRQIQISFSRDFGGTGLGLSITKRLVELMGGKLQIRSAEGKGTRVSFFLPFQTELDESDYLGRMA